MMPRPLVRLAIALGALLLAGCATSYIPPGGHADLQAFGAPSIKEGFAAKPTAPFPATLAFVRVQAPAYINYNMPVPAATGASGRYSVITTREVEDDAQVERLGRLPQITGVTTVNRLLLPARLEGDKEVREAAARLQADLVLVYTFDTAFFETDLARPLTVVTLGFAPTRKVVASTTVSALLMDTRTGYIYSTYEATQRADTQASAWGSKEAADAARRDNERKAFGDLLGEMEKTWPKLLARYAHPS